MDSRKRTDEAHATLITIFKVGCTPNCDPQLKVIKDAPRNTLHNKVNES